MTLPKYKLRDTSMAVLARNHFGFLDEAVRLSRKRPERLITFRAAKSWVSAFEAMKYHDTLPIYFVPIGKDGINVEYQATLHTIYLDPKREEPETENLLNWCLESTHGESLWNKEVQTLYVIGHCRKLKQPFPMTQLVKMANDKPISADYRYSYSLVYRPIADTDSEAERLPNELPPRRYPEGAAKTISVNAYERSSAARDSCIEHYGLHCAVCGMNFEQVYGERGAGFIHVHHLKSLSKVNRTYRVDPIEDLRPVCPNCHAMLHRSDPPCSIEELKEIWLAHQQS